MFGPDEGGLTGGIWIVGAHQWSGELSRNFWSVRVCEPWNGLPDEVKRAKRMDALKI